MCFIPAVKHVSVAFSVPKGERFSAILSVVPLSSQLDGALCVGGMLLLFFRLMITITWQDCFF